MTRLNFKPNNVTSNLISGLKDRTRDIVAKRYGLGYDEGETLEAIGDKYGITRERVRQIINFALNSIKESPAMEATEPAFLEIKNAIDERGGVLFEGELLNYLAPNPAHQNHLYFLLELGDDFTRLREDDNFNHRWTTDKETAEAVEQVLHSLHKEMGSEKVYSEKEMLEFLKEKAKTELKKEMEDEILRSWLNISKIISNNSMGEWGPVSSPFIRPRGTRDLAYLILKRHGSPLHFSEVAKKIGESFDKEAHLATVHNELIKDDRFVLVGRGIYALGEWGYRPGTVREVIEKILEANGPLGREEIVKNVLRERYIKENTILIGLQNHQYFRKNKEGKYVVV